MRRVVIALVVVLICASAATGVRVHASTECERWVAEYRDALAHSPTVKRAKAAGHRIHHYIHRKIAALTKPKPVAKPHAIPIRHRGPKMTREEMLRRFELACGDLPEDSPEGGSLPQDPTPTFIADRKPGGDEMPLDEDSPGMMLAMNQPPILGGGAPTEPGGPGFFLPPGFGGFPGGGAPHGNIPTNPPVTGTTGDTPSTQTQPPAPPTAETPEPASLLLMATGLVGVAGAIRRRQRAALSRMV